MDIVTHFTVILDQNYREDDAAIIAAAISLIRGVAVVHPGHEDANAAFVGYQRAKNEILQQLMAANYETARRLQDEAKKERQRTTVEMWAQNEPRHRGEDPS